MSGRQSTAATPARAKPKPAPARGQGRVAQKTKAGLAPRKGKARAMRPTPEEDTDAPEVVSSNRRAAAALPEVPETKR